MVLDGGALMAIKPVPHAYHTVTPYLIVKGGTQAIEFYKKAFGAKERMRLPAPGDTIGHAELQIGDSILMLADEFPEMKALSPKTIGGTPVSLCNYVDDVDATFKQALSAGGTEMRAVQDQFYGDRSGTLEDPFGHTWTIATHIEDVSPEEMARRAQKQMQNA
jgi:PhnB protein